MDAYCEPREQTEDVLLKFKYNVLTWLQHAQGKAKYIPAASEQKSQPSQEFSGNQPFQSLQQRLEQKIDIYEKFL